MGRRSTLARSRLSCNFFSMEWPSWGNAPTDRPRLLDRVSIVCRRRHFSRNTEQAYRYWTRQFSANKGNCGCRAFPVLRAVHGNSGHSESVLRFCRDRSFEPETTFTGCAAGQWLWITSSARVTSACGIVRPSAFAVLRLITSSNLVSSSVTSAGKLRRPNRKRFTEQVDRYEDWVRSCVPRIP